MSDKNTPQTRNEEATIERSAIRRAVRGAETSDKRSNRPIRDKETQLNHLYSPLHADILKKLQFRTEKDN